MAIDPTLRYVDLGTTGGTSTAYTATPSPAIASYETGRIYQVKINASCGASPTLNASALGAKNIFKATSSGLAACAANDFQTNQILLVIYDGTQFQVVNPIQSSGGGGGGQSLITTDFGDWLGEPGSQYVASNGALTPAVRYVPNLANAIKITSITELVATGQAGSNARVALYDLAGNLIAQSNSQTTTANNTPVVFAFSPSVTITDPGFYFAHMADNGSTTFYSADAGFNSYYYNHGPSVLTWFYTTAQGSLLFPSTLGGTRSDPGTPNIMPAARFCP